MVYFIQGKITKLIKIGRVDRVAKNPVALRIKELQVGSPDELVVLLCIPEWNKKEESFLHKKFAHLRVHGEWFKLEQELLDFITKSTEIEWLTYESARYLRDYMDEGPKASQVKRKNLEDLEEKRFKEKLRQIRAK